MHSELTCPGCGHRTFFALSESGKSHECPSCGTTCVVPQLGQPVSGFTLSDKAKEIRASNSVARQSSHVFLRILSALFVTLATLNLAMAVWTTVAYYSTTNSAYTFSDEGSLVLNNAVRNLTQRSRSKIQSALAIVSILSTIECVAFFVIARCLRKMTHYRSCFLIALLACLTIPFGMALGVATIVVLMDQDVSQTFYRHRQRTAS